VGVAGQRQVNRAFARAEKREQHSSQAHIGR
jgi:hypothetical protein